MFNKQFLLVAHNMRSERLTVNFSVGRNCCDSIFVIRFVTCDTSGAGEREREREREREKAKKEVESDSFHTAEATAFHSDPLSHHCCWHPVLPALLPAWADAQIINCQDTSAYAGESLQTSSLVGEDHPHGKQGIQDSTALHHPRSMLQAMPIWRNPVLMHAFST